MEEPKRSMSREELHDLVWSTPMQKLAEIYRLSDRGLAKTCARYLVPVPPRGYWAKVDAGHQVRRTPLRAVANVALHTVHIGANPLRATSHYLDEVLAAAKREMAEEDERIAQILSSEKLVSTSSLTKLDLARNDKATGAATLSIGNTHRDVRPFLADLGACKADRDGFIHFKYVRVSPKDIPRIGSLLSLLVSQLEPYGFSFDYTSNRIAFSKNGTKVDFGIEAPRKRVTEVSKHGWKDISYVHIGRLTLQIYGQAEGVKKYWSDTASKQLEQAVDGLVDSFRVNHVAEKKRDEERRQESERAALLARRRAMAQLRIKREDERLKFLRTISEARREADDLRATIALLPPASCFSSDYARMVAWAQSRLQTLESSTTVRIIQATLEETGLYPDPDPLFDPEGEPPPKKNSWDP